VERLSYELVTAVWQGTEHELVPFTGQSVGTIRGVQPVDEIMRRLVGEAEEALRTVTSLLRQLKSPISRAPG
jgi:hypothetical protein